MCFITIYSSNLANPRSVVVDLWVSNVSGIEVQLLYVTGRVHEWIVKTFVDSSWKNLETKSLRAVQGKGKDFVFCCVFVFFLREGT